MTTNAHVEDENAIKLVLKDYFDGLYFGRIDQFSRAFHPEARLFTATDTGIAAIDFAPYIDRCASRPAPAASGAVQVAEILELTVSSKDSAHARVRDAFPPKTYINELSLAKANGRWGIVAKLYHAEA